MKIIDYKSTNDIDIEFENNFIRKNLSYKDFKCSCITKTGKRKNKWLGAYDNPYDAFIAYKTFKENHIKECSR